MRARLTLLAAALAIFGMYEVGAASWIHAKGFIAQRLIAAAWRRAASGAAPERPWPWADMRPVARLTVPARRIELYVMDGASGRALAFGPGLVAGTAAPASAGNTVIVAHRDTHFTFLKALARGDEIDLQPAGGTVARYRVSDAAVVDRDDVQVMEDAGAPRLTLITCYPFDAIRPGTRYRYVIVAARVA
jgi:sortase A